MRVLIIEDDTKRGIELVEIARKYFIHVRSTDIESGPKRISEFWPNITLLRASDPDKNWGYANRATVECRRPGFIYLTENGEQVACSKHDYSIGSVEWDRVDEVLRDLSTLPENLADYICRTSGLLGRDFADIWEVIVPAKNNPTLPQKQKDFIRDSCYREFGERHGDEFGCESDEIASSVDAHKGQCVPCQYVYSRFAEGFLSQQRTRLHEVLGSWRRQLE